jgi:hypothetical protein
MANILVLGADKLQAKPLCEMPEGVVMRGPKNPLLCEEESINALPPSVAGEEGEEEEEAAAQAQAMAVEAMVAYPEEQGIYVSSKTGKKKSQENIFSLQN